LKNCSPYAFKEKWHVEAMSRNKKNKGDVSPNLRFLMKNMEFRVDVLKEKP